MEKPDGLVALTPDLLHDALSALTPRDLPGVGARMEKRLDQAGISTMEQLLALDREQLHTAWGGIGGEKLWHWLRGEDFGDQELEHQKSIGHSHVLPPELRTPEGAYAVANKLLHKAAMRLRKARLWASNMTLTIRFSAGVVRPRQSRGRKAVRCWNARTTRRCWKGCSGCGVKVPRRRDTRSRFSWASHSATWFPTICIRLASSPALKKRENGRGFPPPWTG